MALLLGPDALRVVQPAAPPGAAIRSLRATQVLFRPRDRVAVTYRATLGIAEAETIVALAARGGPPAGAHVAHAGDQPVAVWRAAQDPKLPCLAQALDPEFGHRLLAAAGVRARAAGVALRAYRPGRRAVVEVRPFEPEPARLVFSRTGSGILRAASPGGAPALYLKVLEPDRAAAVAAVHGRLAELVPAPPCALGDGPGILRLGTLTGASLGRCLRRGTPRAPAVADVLALLARLGEAGLPGSPAGGSDARLLRQATVLEALVPEEGERLARLCGALQGAREQPTVTVHGDFHEGNLLVADGSISGPLDVDDAGPGERVDDLGLLIGRLLSLHARGAGERVARYGDELLRRSGELVDPDELRRRVGVALVGRATAPFRNQFEDWRAETRRRLAHAERWVAADRSLEL